MSHNRASSIAGATREYVSPECHQKHQAHRPRHVVCAAPPAAAAPGSRQSIPALQLHQPHAVLVGQTTSQTVSNGWSNLPRQHACTPHAQLAPHRRLSSQQGVRNKGTATGTQHNAVGCTQPWVPLEAAAAGSPAGAAQPLLPAGAVKRGQSITAGGCKEGCPQATTQTHSLHPLPPCE